MSTNRSVRCLYGRFLAFALSACLSTTGSLAQTTTQPDAGRADQPRQSPRPSGSESQQEKRGLVLNTGAAFSGYTFFAPMDSTTTYLVDLQGKLLHSWPSKYTAGQAACLLDDGSILRAGRQPRNPHFGGGGIGGRVERIDPEGKVVWKYRYANKKHCQHHDIRPLPNGNVLLIAWEKKTRDEALAAGCDPKEMTGYELWPDCIVEVQPRGESGGKIVWEWHVWDHLVQDLDANKPNYGAIAEHPELVDLNYQRIAPRETPAEVQRLRALGYVGGGEPDNTEDTEEKGQSPPPFFAGMGGPDMRADWCHTNAIDYNAKLDQIAMSVHTFNEIWIIDHGTTMKEAAGHSGGRYGKGGDLLYRWGNPRAYGAGGARDQTLFAQHDVRWIPEGMPGAGHLTVFNNGPGRPDGMYSSIVEIAPPIDASGHYRLERGKAFGPAKPTWEYTAARPVDFFSSHISGAERLPNGNTLICAGEQGRIFEVTAAGKTVWEYLNPYTEHLGPDGGFGPMGGLRRMFGPPPGMRPPQDPPAGGSGDDRPGRQAGPTSRPAGGDNGGDTGERRADRPGRGEDRNGPADGQRRPGRPPGAGPWGPPGGPGFRSGPPGGPGFPGGPPGGPGGPGGGLFRANRLAPNHPGIRRLLELHKGG